MMCVHRCPKTKETVYPCKVPIATISQHTNDKICAECITPASDYLGTGPTGAEETSPAVGIRYKDRRWSVR
jgi:hypothetical protein